MLVLLQGLIPKKPDDEDGKENEEEEEEEEDTYSSEEGDGTEGSKHNHLKPDNILYI